MVTNLVGDRAWILPFTSSAILVVYGLLYPVLLLFRSPPLSGKSYDEVATFSRGLASFLSVAVVIVGLSVLGLGILGMAISRISYRKGERWAWYTLWYLVIFSTLGVVADLGISGSIAYTFILVAILSVLGQLLSYKRFFREEP